MPAFVYTGITAKGKSVKATASADNVAMLKAVLKRQGIYLTSVNETSAARGGAASTSGDSSVASSLFDRVSPVMVAQMTQLLATLLRAGITLPEALRALADQTESPRLRSMLSTIQERVNEGSSLADAMKTYPTAFPSLYINMVRAGEASGALETVLLRLAEFMDKQNVLRSKIISALMYPLLLSVISGAIIVILLVRVVPNITEMFTDMSAKMPWNTRLLIAISTLFSRYWIVLVLLAIGTVLLFRRWRQSPRGRWQGDAILLRIPVVSELVLKIAVSRFSRTLSTLLTSGVQLLEALDITRALLGNVVLEKVVNQARDSIREGDSVASALKRSGRFPPLVTHMIGVGERSGQLEEMLLNVADTYEQETDATLGRFTELLGPLMIAVMGMGVGFIVFSIMTPIMMLTNMAGT